MGNSVKTLEEKTDKKLVGSLELSTKLNRRKFIIPKESMQILKRLVAKLFLTLSNPV